jgi:hypothetical protein
MKLQSQSYAKIPIATSPLTFGSRKQSCPVAVQLVSGPLMRSNKATFARPLTKAAQQPCAAF